MEQYNVTGMSCAACSARVEKAVSKVPGVESCSVSLLTNSMGVEGTALPRDIIAAVEAAGYGASLKWAGNAEATEAANEDALVDRETPVLKKRLIASVCLLIPLLYLSMGHMMWGWPLPGWFDGNHVAMGLVQLVLTGLIMVINLKFFISGFRALLHRAPNMDTLVALGASASFLWSLYVLFAMTRAVVDGNSEAVMGYMMDFYFESAATILTLITVGKMLEARAKGRTTDALKGLMKLAPKTAVLVRDGVEVEVPIAQVRKGDMFAVRPGESIPVDGVEVEVPIAQVRKGDMFAVRPGESIPVDGVVLEGVSAVNEAALTGESIPVDKAEGDSVSAATINQSGYLRCEATRVGEDTTLSQIIKMVSDAAATKAPIAKIADRVSGVFVPVVIGIAILATAIWLLVGQPIGYALARGISVLVISCPCALGLATPVAIMVGNGMGAKNGILFKTAVSLEEAGKVNVVALDKTGTITQGEPGVTDILPAGGFDEASLLQLAASIERSSEHPLAKAVMKEAEVRNIIAQEVTGFKALPGNGVSAALDGEAVVGGSVRFIAGQTKIPEALAEQARTLSDEGKTPLLFMRGGRLAGIIAVADLIKEDSRQAVQELQNMGIRVIMLTGDNERTAKAIGAQAGVDEVVAGVLPDGKESVVRQLKKYGKVAMVGDGINDAPALTRADIGIAIGAGTDVAIDAADVVLMKSRLLDVPAAIRLSRATLRNIHENLFWAFIYNIIGIPLAAGAFIKLFGWTLNPMFGAAAMSLSSFSVVSNALRLNLFNIRDAGRDRKRGGAAAIPVVAAGPADEAANADGAVEPDGAESATSGVKLKIAVEGMMCEHCEARVKKALEGLPGVESASADFHAGVAVLIASGPVDHGIIRRTIEEQDYGVGTIERTS